MDKAFILKGEPDELEYLAAIFKLDYIPESFKDNWRQACLSYPDSIPFFLTDDFIDSIVKEIPIMQKLNSNLRSAAKLVQEDERLLKISWLWYYLCYIVHDWRGLYSWPHLCNSIGEDGNFVPILILLSEYSNLSKFYKKYNVPQKHYRTTYEGIISSLTSFKRNHREPGRGNAALAWITRYIAGKLFYLGRLQYEFIKCHNDIYVYKNKDTDEVICLAQNGEIFTKDGIYANPVDLGREGIWISQYSESDGYIYGNPISPDSYVIDRTIELDSMQWELILKKGDTAITIHIPAGRSLNIDEVKESYQYAEFFFTTYFPNYSWRVIMCNSWLLDTKLRDFLSEGSNIVKFQDSFYLLPGPYTGDNAGVYKFLFGVKDCPPDRLPVTSSLQQKVKDYIIDGGFIRSGGGFIPREDIGKPVGYYKKIFSRTSIRRM